MLFRSKGKSSEINDYNDIGDFYIKHMKDTKDKKKVKEKVIEKEKEKEKEREKDNKNKKIQAKIASGEFPGDDTLSSDSHNGDIKEKENSNTNKSSNSKSIELKSTKPSKFEKYDNLKAEMEKSKEKILMGLKRKRQKSSISEEDNENSNSSLVDKDREKDKDKDNNKDKDKDKDRDKDKDKQKVKRKYKERKPKINETSSTSNMNGKPNKKAYQNGNDIGNINKIETQSQPGSESSKSLVSNSSDKEEKIEVIQQRKRGKKPKNLNTNNNNTSTNNNISSAKLSFNPGARVTRSQEQEVNTQKEDMILDMVSSSKGITINSNTAICSANSKNEHRCVFANIILNDTEKKWQVKVVNLKNWLGVGVSLKEVVICNKFKFVYSNPLFNHGTYMISSNGISWNSNNQKENNTKIKNFPGIKVGDVITLTYNARKSELEFTIGDFEYVMHDVVSIRAFLVPTVVFLSIGDEVTLDSL